VLHPAHWKCKTQKIAKNSPSGHHRTNCRAISWQQETYRQTEKMLNSNVSPRCPHNMVNFSTLAAEICWRIWGTHFNGFRVLALLLQRRRSPEANQTFHNVWPSPALVHYIHFRGFCPRRSFASCKLHFASKSCVLLYWQHYCTALDQWASARLRRGTYGTFADGATYVRLGGHHVGHWPTF